MVRFMISVFRSISGAVLLAERWAMILLSASVTGLILLNVVTRATNNAIYWVDEAAIYAMVWLVMIGASAIIRLRRGISVTIVEDMLSPAAKRISGILVDAVLLLLAGVLIWTSVLWYDPVALIASDFDIAAFSGSTFNFIYKEPTNTLGLPKYLIWLVMPITAVTMTIHAATNFAERLAGQVTDFTGWED